MIIRSYREANLAAIADLFTASVHSLAVGHYDAVQRAAWAPQPPDLTYWRERLRSMQTLIAEEDGALAGFIAYEQNGHIDLLFTAPEYARRGVASLLYRHVESALLILGVEALFTEASLVARPFFERQGFRVEEEQHVKVRGAWFRRYAMRKPVIVAG